MSESVAHKSLADAAVEKRPKPSSPWRELTIRLAAPGLDEARMRTDSAALAAFADGLRAVLGIEGAIHIDSVRLSK